MATEVFFIIDTVLRFNLGYLESGFLVMKRKRIIKNYLKKDFAFNLITCLPITIV